MCPAGYVNKIQPPSHCDRSWVTGAATHVGMSAVIEDRGSDETRQERYDRYNRYEGLLQEWGKMRRTDSPLWEDHDIKHRTIRSTVPLYEQIMAALSDEFKKGSVESFSTKAMDDVQYTIDKSGNITFFEIIAIQYYPKIEGSYDREIKHKFIFRIGYGKRLKGYHSSRGATFALFGHPGTSYLTYTGTANDVVDFLYGRDWEYDETYRENEVLKNAVDLLARDDMRYLFTIIRTDMDAERPFVLGRRQRAYY